MNGVSSSTVARDHRSVLPLALSVPSISSNSAETFPWISMTCFAFTSSASARSSPPRQLRDLLRRAGRPACARAACRAPSARRPCAACASTSNATCTAPRGAAARRPRPASCTRQPWPGSRSLVLRRERPALGLLDQLRVRHPRRRGAPAGHESQLAYASLVFAAGGSSLIRCPSSIRTRLQHVRRSPFSPSRSLIPRW